MVPRGRIKGNAARSRRDVSILVNRDIEPFHGDPETFCHGLEHPADGGHHPHGHVPVKAGAEEWERLN